MQQSYLLYTFAGAILVPVLWTLLSILFSPLRSIPGPFLARFTRLWYLFRLRQERFEQENIDLHRKYGPVVRLSPDHYSIDDPNAVNVIYGLGRSFPKGVWYSGFTIPKSDRWSIFFVRDIQVHAEARRALHGLYSMTSLVTYEQYVDECADLLCSKLRKLAERDESVDLAQWLLYYAFDVITSVSCGQRMGFLDQGEDVVGTLKTLRSLMVYATPAGVYHEWHSWMHALMQYMPGSGAKGKLTIHAYIGKQNAQRRQKRAERDGKLDPVEGKSETGPRDFLDKILDAHEENPKKVTDYHVSMVLIANTIAGADTTGSTLAATVYRLLTNPEALRKLEEEIQRHNPTVSQPENDGFSFKDTQEMTYLQAVLKESMRLFSSVGLCMWRTVPERGAQISGRFFPPGVQVGINPWVAHHNRTVFGDDVEMFRPGRWLPDIAHDQKTEQIRSKDNYWMPFGLGSRNCLGRTIAMLEMNKLLPKLIKEFRFELVESPEKAWRTTNYWFVKPNELLVKVSIR